VTERIVLLTYFGLTYKSKRTKNECGTTNIENIVRNISINIDSDIFLLVIGGKRLNLTRRIVLHIIKVIISKRSSIII